MTQLCAFCSGLDLRSAGYYRPAPQPHVQDAESSVSDTDDEDGGAGEEGHADAEVADGGTLSEEEDEYDDGSDPDAYVHSVPEMLANSETCRFCGELSRLFRRWLHETFPGRGIADLALADSEIKVTQGPLATTAQRLGNDGRDNPSLYTTVRVIMLMRDPDRPHLDNHFYWPGITLAYQRVLWEAWPRLRDVLDAMDARAAEGQSPLAVWSHYQPYSARQRTGRVDLRLLRRWKEACHAWHGDRCRSRHARLDGHSSSSSSSSTSRSSKPQMLRLIDVDAMCLVEVPDRSAVSWVVLSYVWGRAPFFTLTSANRRALMQAGSLAGDGAFPLPDTVADAIVATRGLGERYLWVDSVCVVQDSNDDKARFVPAMDDIYGRAVITIVDLGGADAFHGLPGVTGDRFADREHFPAPEPLIINGTRIVRAPQPTGTGYQNMDMQASCVYLQRGWTFQEALLSRRFVLFTADTVFWECAGATWREDGNWEVEGARDTQDSETDNEAPDIFHNPFLTLDSTVRYDRLWGPSAEDLDASYQALAFSFSRRQLSFEGDGLAAFSGVLSALQRTATAVTAAAQPPLRFLWGLPAPYLGVALTWPADRDEISALDADGLPATDAPPFFYRRTGKCLIFQRGEGAAAATAEVPFPSWSWVGWVGPVLFEELFGSLLSEHAGIRFYVFGDTDTESEQLVEVRQHTAFQDRWPASETHVRAPPLWRETSSSGNVVDASAVPERVRRDAALRQIVLAFWTSCCARLHVAYEPRTLVDGELAGTSDIWEEAPGPTEPSQPRVAFTGSWVQRPPRSWRAGEHVVECIVVGRDNLDNMAADSRLVVLVTERVGAEEEALQGTRRRVAALNVKEKEWNRLQTRRWEVVVLV